MTKDITPETDTPTTPSKKPFRIALSGFIAALSGVLVLGGLSGFAIGMAMGKSGATNTVSNFAGQNRSGDPEGGFGGPGMRRMNGAIGIVTAVSGNSITVENQMRGGTSTYTIGSSTTVTDGGESASVSDITVGDRVLVRTSQDDSGAAASIMLNPTFGGGSPGTESQDDASRT